MSYFLNALAMHCALGNDLATIREHLFAGSSPGMQRTDRYSPGRSLQLGQVNATLPSLDAYPIAMRSRNNALLLSTWQQIRAQVKQACAGIPAHRIAVVLGTSTSGISEVEAAIAQLQQSSQLPSGFHYSQHELGSPADFLASEIGAMGPTYCISTACTSSAKALASAARLLKSDQADVVITGGVDTLARFTVAGFSALESVAEGPCLPFSAHRSGINIGEGAALFLMSRETGPAQLAGWGESSDGHHISAPDPTGSGARLAIQAALSKAQLAASDIDYINLHGTATPLNDAMESQVSAEFYPSAPASSTKPLTGHTLGAAGAIEAGICWLTLTDSAYRLPPHIWDGAADPALPALSFIHNGQTAPRPVRSAISHSFAFGGNNAALVFTR